MSGGEGVRQRNGQDRAAGVETFAEYREVVDQRRGLSIRSDLEDLDVREADRERIDRPVDCTDTCTTFPVAPVPGDGDWPMTLRSIEFDGSTAAGGDDPGAISPPMVEDDITRRASSRSTSSVGRRRRRRYFDREYAMRRYQGVDGPRRHVRKTLC